MAKHKSRNKRLSEAIGQLNNGLAEVQALQEEIESWRDNMAGTNLESTDKYQQLEDCATTLESASGEIENAISELETVEFPGMFG